MLLTQGSIFIWILIQNACALITINRLTQKTNLPFETFPFSMNRMSSGFVGEKERRLRLIRQDEAK